MMSSVSQKLASSESSPQGLPNDKILMCFFTLVTLEKKHTEMKRLIQLLNMRHMSLAWSKNPILRDTWNLTLAAP